MISYKLAFTYFVVVLYRLILPLRCGQFGPDESLFIVKAYNVLNSNEFPLVGMTGNFGIVYGPSAVYYFSILYGVTGFRLGWAFFISTILILSSAFLVAASIQKKQNRFWTFLLAVTSPLAIYFSTTGLWDTPLLMPLSATVIFLTSTTRFNTWRKEFIIGILIGLSLSIHIQAVPFAIGIMIWRTMVKKNIKLLAVFISGTIVILIPYLVGLYQVRDTLTFKSNIISNEANLLNVLSLFTSLYRFWGAHSELRVNLETNTSFIAAENVLAKLTSYFTLIIIAISIVLLIINGYKYYFLGKRVGSLENPMSAFFICAVTYLPFAYITNTGMQPHYGQSLWWFAPIAFPVIVTTISSSRFAGLWLSLLVAFNISVTAVEYIPRFVAGTEAANHTARGQGPSWWMQENIIKKLCVEIETLLQYDKKDTIVVEVAPVRFIDVTLENLLKVQYPNCASRVKWTTSTQSGNGVILRIEPDAEQTSLQIVRVER